MNVVIIIGPAIREILRMISGIDSGDIKP